MPPPRHGRRPTFSKLTIAVVILVVLGVLGVGLFADVGLALRLAVAGALVVSVMIWSIYAEALREARRDHAHERALHQLTASELESLQRDHEREVSTLTARVDELEAQLAATRSTATESAEMWPSLSDAPTVVDMAGRRDARPAVPLGLDLSADTA